MCINVLKFSVVHEISLSDWKMNTHVFTVLLFSLRELKCHTFFWDLWWWSSGTYSEWC